MVLRFKNEKELSLYFDSVDQLSQIIILKGQRVLLEKEHYGEIIEQFLDLNKNFLNFLIQDEYYGEILESQNNDKIPKDPLKEAQKNMKSEEPP